MPKRRTLPTLPALLVLTATLLLGGRANAALIDLAFLLDSSGSVGAANWNTIKGGLANAMLGLAPTIPTSDTYRVTVVGFGTTASTIVAPTLIDSNAAINNVRNSILVAPFTGGYTNLGQAIELTSDLVADAGGVGLGLMNISTDGQPNVDQNGTTNNTPGGEAYALAARDAAIAAGWDSFSVEAIGNNLDINWLTNTFVYPQPGVLVPPNAIPDPLDNGFVIRVTSVAAYPAAISAKIQTIVAPTPEPATLALFSLGLLGLGVARRKRFPE